MWYIKQKYENQNIDYLDKYFVFFGFDNQK